MMSKIVLILSLLALVSCKESGRSILVVGDSWSTFICEYNSLDRALVKAGINDVKVQNTCFTTTRVGVRAQDWLDTAFHKTALLKLADPGVEVIYLSLGGNDIMNEWNKSMTLAEEQVVFDRVIGHIQKVVSTYQKLRPDLKIILSGYDFPRFYLDHPIAEYREAFDEMGRPTPFEMNSAVVRFSDRIAKIADQKKLFYIQHYGLMQYHFGNSDVNLKPGQTLSPNLISTPENPIQVGGILDYQSDQSVFFKVKLNGKEITDAFHLNKAGYDKIADQVVGHYLKDWL